MQKIIRGPIEAVLQKLRDEENIRGLVHSANKKSPSITVENIVDAARRDSFSTYLRVHNLERPEPPQLSDWDNGHDCLYLRSHGYLNRKGYGTLLVYIGIAQLADYLDCVCGCVVDWRKLTITDARLLFKQLCDDIGVRPRAFGPFLVPLVKATVGQRNNLAIYGGKKLIAPPPWCTQSEVFEQLMASLRDKHYRAQAKRQGREPVDAEGVPQFGARTPKRRAPRTNKPPAAKRVIVIESSEDESSAKSGCKYHVLSGRSHQN
jgi:hypothetical protein